MTFMGAEKSAVGANVLTVIKANELGGPTVLLALRVGGLL